MPMPTAWTQKEIAILKEHGSNKTSKHLVELLPRHSSKAIATKRHRLKINGPFTRTQVPWLISEIELMKQHACKLPIEELAKLFPTRSQASVAGQRQRMGLYLEKKTLTRIRSNCSAQLDYSFCLNDLDDVTFQVLIGSLLGDGCVMKKEKGVTYFFSEVHCDAQADYVKWKIEKLNVFAPRFCKLGYGAECTTKTHPIFTSLRNKFYPPGKNCLKNKIPLDLMENLNLLGLLIWYLDDGTLGNSDRRTPYPYITAKGWDYQELLKFANILNKKFSSDIRVLNDRDHKVVLPRSIFKIMKQLALEQQMPKCMLYKLKTSDE
jgi:hypothetical protein